MYYWVLFIGPNLIFFMEIYILSRLAHAFCFSMLGIAFRLCAFLPLLAAWKRSKHDPDVLECLHLYMPYGFASLFLFLLSFGCFISACYFYLCAWREKEIKRWNLPAIFTTLILFLFGLSVLPNMCIIIYRFSYEVLFQGFIGFLKDMSRYS